MTSQPPYFFAYLGRSRPWNPIPGATPLSELCHEIRALPGGLYACGDTFDEVISNIRSLISKAVEINELSFQEWYSKQLGNMSKVDRFAMEWVRKEMVADSLLMDDIMGKGPKDPMRASFELQVGDVVVLIVEVYSELTTEP